MQVNAEARICCKRPKILKLIIDGGTTPDVIVKVCKEHSQIPCFNKFVKSKEEL